MTGDSGRPEESKHRKVTCNAARITTLAVDERIAKLVQIVLDLGIDLSGTFVSEQYKTFELDFYDVASVSHFYDLAVTGGEKDDLTARAAAVLDDDEKCWHVHVAPVPPRNAKEGWCMSFTVEIPLADYDHLVTVLAAAAASAASEDAEE